MIMHLRHSKWDEFADRLHGPGACDIQEDPEGFLGLTWTCFHDYRFASGILRDMGGVSFDETIAYFESKNGFEICNRFKKPHPIFYITLPTRCL